MVIRRGCGFRLGASPAGDHQLTTFGGQARGVWNQARAVTRRRLDQGVPLKGCEDLAGLAAFGKDTAEWGVLADAPSQPLPQRRSDLARAFHEAVGPTQPAKRPPRSKKRGRDDTLRFPRGVAMAGSRVRLPKLGWVTFFQRRPMPGVLKNPTVSRHGFVPVQTEQAVAAPVPQAPTDCGGGDLGGAFSGALRRDGGRRPAGGLCAPALAEGAGAADARAPSKGFDALADDQAAPQRPACPDGGPPPRFCAAPQHHRQPTPRDGGAGGSAHSPHDGHGDGHPGAAGQPCASAGGLNRAILEKAGEGGRRLGAVGHAA